MHGTAVDRHLPIHVVGAHFILEGSDVGGLDVGIVGALQDDDLGLDVLAVGRVWAVEAAVETDHSLHVSARAGQLDDAGAAEAVAGRDDPGRVHFLLLAQNLQSAQQSFAVELAVALVLPGQRHRVLRTLGAHAFAVDVDGEHGQTQLGHAFGLLLGLVGDAKPVVHHEHARYLSLARLWVNI